MNIDFLRSPLSILVITLSALTAEHAAAAADPAELNNASTFIQTLANDTIAILQDKTDTQEGHESRFRVSMEKSFDVEFVAKLALGRHWRTASVDQQAVYLDLFDDFMLNTILSNLSGFGDEKLLVTGSQPAGKKDIMVASKIQSGNDIYEVDWRVRYFGDVPKVIDVKAEGVSMVIKNREEFSSIIQRDGMDGFLQILQTKIDTLKAESAAASAKEARDSEEATTTQNEL